MCDFLYLVLDVLGLQCTPVEHNKIEEATPRYKRESNLKGLTIMEFAFIAACRLKAFIKLSLLLTDKITHKQDKC